MYPKLRTRRRWSVALLGAPVALLAWAIPLPAGAITLSLAYDPSVPPAYLPVIDQAAKYWEARITSSDVFQVNVFLGTLPQGQLGLASNYTSTGGQDPQSGLFMGTPKGGTVTFTNNPPVPFFIDPTPADDSEYLMLAAPTTYFSVDPLGPAVGQIDLLTLALHEFGHALGFSSAFEKFFLNLFPSQTGSHEAYVFPLMPALGDPLTDYLQGFFPWGSALMPVSEVDAEEAGSVGGKPSHLDDVPSGDPSGGLFDFDVMNESLQQDERIHIANVDLDILADAYGYSVVPEPEKLLQALVAVAALLLLSRFRRGLTLAPAGVALGCALALSACGSSSREELLAECKPLIERRCAGVSLERKCRSTHSASCTMIGPEKYRQQVERWERSR